MIQFRTLFLSVFGLFMMACAREEIIVSETSVQDTPIGMQAQKGRLRLKFKSRFAGKAEQAVYTRAGTGDLRIVSLKRLFPFAGKFEERTRKAGLHLWYEVEFDEQTPVTRALALLGDTTEIEIAEPVYIIRNTGGEGTVPVRSAGERNSDGTAPFNDPELSRQWHYSNTGELPNSVAGADINLFAAWQKNQGSREVIVAVIDGGIDYRHEDLSGNVGNPAELFGEPGVDDDGNGYIDDIYGWNFINGTNQIEADDHGTHVAGTIGAENNNGVGVCGIAGGHGGNTGVWLLSCQLFGTIDGREVSASFPEMIKYAADAGAVIAQNSWGYENITYLPRADQDAIDYFIQSYLLQVMKIKITGLIRRLMKKSFLLRLMLLITKKAGIPILPTGSISLLRAGHTAMGGSITVNALYTVRYRITSTAICRGHLWLVLMFRVSLL